MLLSMPFRLMERKHDVMEGINEVFSPIVVLNPHRKETDSLRSVQSRDSLEELFFSAVSQ